MTTIVVSNSEAVRSNVRPTRLASTIPVNASMPATWETRNVHSGPIYRNVSKMRTVASTMGSLPRVPTILYVKKENAFARKIALRVKGNVIRIILISILLANMMTALTAITGHPPSV